MKTANRRRTPASNNRAHADLDDCLQRKLQNPAFRAAVNARNEIIERYYRPALARRRALLEDVHAGRMGEDKLPVDLIMMIALEADPAWADFHGWSPHVAVGGWLAIHDVFPDPADGGRPPYELFCAALDSGEFVEDGACGSLRVLRRVAVAVAIATS